MNVSGNNRSDGQVSAGGKRVEAVDYQCSAGQGQEVRHVHVIHETTPQPIGGTATSGGVLTEAAAAINNTLQAAKNAATSGK